MLSPSLHPFLEPLYTCPSGLTLCYLHSLSACPKLAVSREDGRSGFDVVCNDEGAMVRRLISHVEMEGGDVSGLVDDEVRGCGEKEDIAKRV
ncbi:hypothetical protein TrRE_jg1081 [Triparma retinervis]|uniref:Uncharacterized protein n=1 Tax=Triparma retinervis TaxID=2557542 RepID=A0A9W7A9D7_9STRA|nr:hypothetical protein TrRE_jg1081 [Triparma retinervis]